MAVMGTVIDAFGRGRSHSTETSNSRRQGSATRQTWSIGQDGPAGSDPAGVVTPTADAVICTGPSPPAPDPLASATTNETVPDGGRPVVVPSGRVLGDSMSTKRAAARGASPVRTTVAGVEPSTLACGFAWLVAIVAAAATMATMSTAIRRRRYAHRSSIRPAPSSCPARDAGYAARHERPRRRPRRHPHLVNGRRVLETRAPRAP